MHFKGVLSHIRSIPYHNICIYSTDFIYIYKVCASIQTYPNTYSIYSIHIIYPYQTWPLIDIKPPGIVWEWYGEHTFLFNCISQTFLLICHYEHDRIKGNIKNKYIGKNRSKEIQTNDILTQTRLTSFTNSPLSFLKPQTDKKKKKKKECQYALHHPLCSNPLTHRCIFGFNQFRNSAHS